MRQPGPWEAVVVLLSWVVLDRVILRWTPAPLCLSPGAVYWAIGLARILETALLAAYWRARGRGFSDFGLSGPTAGRGLKLGAVSALAIGGLVLLAEVAVRVLTGSGFLKALAGRTPSGQEFFALLVVGGVIGPVFEEFLFRGVLYPGFRAALGPAPAVILSALVFASAHLSFRGVHPVQAAGGLLFGAAYELSGSLWAPLVLHVTGNLAIFLAPHLF